ncbi:MULTISPECIES: DUF4352 domain-containing protein [unclassified Microbacterium]|uniref:DUF4352 domain-containing protein n=1 Tax=unclassified Microbacterium TaxID=2609290 RepID=UPI001604D300|nr:MULTISPECIES: DUF4352 domain-containing protein [unclassified Microbacterium]QNA91717.1 DUF4352 domain-containing protein [Microbacterium sp. Se63.02b]QYM64908.1 DUF4352 domain-containing protein [Microbacterium sp. Se5.02b]
MLVAPLVALVLVVAGCTAAPDAAKTPAPEGTSTTDWTPPADTDAAGPTEAPTLTEESGALDAPVSLSTDMVVKVDKISTTTIKPETPGEYAGSAVVVTVSVTNDSKKAQSIDSAVVNLTTDDGDVGVATTAGPNEPLSGEVAAGAEATGTYVFMLDPIKGRSVKISVNYAAGEPVATFAGTLS